MTFGKSVFCFVKLFTVWKTTNLIFKFWYVVCHGEINDCVISTEALMLLFCLK